MSDNNIDKDTLKIVLTDQLANFKNTDPGIERQQLKEVKKHLRSPFAIVFSGLRRVGKSTLLAQVAGKFYSNQYYYVNFEDERLMNFDAADFDSLHEILVELFGDKKVFFLDEIQTCLMIFYHHL